MKLRTMIPGIHRSGRVWTAMGDQRIAVFGRVLPRTGLDEPPGILALIRGGVILVGPRPLSIEETRISLEDNPKFGRMRESRPGLTRSRLVH